MPVTPDDVIALLEEATEWSTSTMLILDKALSDKAFLMENKKVIDGAMVFFFKFKGIATRGDIERIKSAYELAGWSTVEVKPLKNSPGAIALDTEVILRKKPTEEKMYIIQ